MLVLFYFALFLGLAAALLHWRGVRYERVQAPIPESARRRR